MDMNNFRKITQWEKHYIESSITDFGMLELQGGSRELKDGKVIYHLSFDFAKLNGNSPEARKIGEILKKKLRADEIWILGMQIA